MNSFFRAKSVLIAGSVWSNWGILWVSGVEKLHKKIWIKERLGKGCREIRGLLFSRSLMGWNAWEALADVYWSITYKFSCMGCCFEWGKNKQWSKGYFIKNLGRKLFKYKENIQWNCWITFKSMSKLDIRRSC